MEKIKFQFADGEEAVYEIVSEDEELEAVSGVFAKMLDDIDLI